jgi:hypothetical protein
MNTVIRTLALGLTVIGLLAMAACGSAPSDTPAPSSALTPEQAAEVAENALLALNSGDYSAWTRDWSADMKAAIKEPDFLQYRQAMLNDFGQFVSVAGVELVDGANPGIVRWVVTADFEKGAVRFDFAFQEDGEQILGVHSEAVAAGG